jgi:2-polyprenyl-3-methyl-5-hydroxy-6-metoxy-1,4-benzoquinol methylase
MSIDTRYIDGSYLQATGGWHSEDAAWKVDHIMSVIGEIAPGLKSIGDIGCGSGDILAQLAVRVPTANLLEGWELAPEAYALTKRHTLSQISFHNKSLFDFPGSKYDLMMAMDVFEHVSDYLGFLEKLREHGERFVFHIPLDASALTIFNEEHVLRNKREEIGHLHYFTKYSALATLEDAGYKILNYKFTHAKVFPPANYLSGKIRQGLRKIVFALSPYFCARTIGGCAMMVLAERAEVNG